MTNNPNHGDVAPAWGTWEELLLAFAVNRHGTAAWDSIAAELRKRISDRGPSVTAQICRHRYLDLRRRFVSSNEGDDGKSDAPETVPLLEELRKLRVAELRREVQRYDLNIESLELKMRNMEEDREKTSRAQRTDSDLDKDGRQGRDAEPSPATATAPEPTAVEPATREEMERDQMSVNESNSTDPLVEKSRTGEKETKPEERIGRKTDEPIWSVSEPDRKSDSCNGSSNSIDVPEHKAKAESASPSADHEDSGGRRGEATKENSDVQSSASKSRKEGGIDKVFRGCTSGDEREREDQSHAVKYFSAESQPLMEFLRSIRAHKLGLVFERRLRSQENPQYRKMIMQHMDLETVESRLKEGFYSGSSVKFFRDLLLIVNNALVFFPANSPESAAASEIRAVVSKEIYQKQHCSKSESSSGKQSLSAVTAKKEEAEQPLMPRIPAGSLIVCRKRSSVAAKDKKKDRSMLLSEAEESKDDSKPPPPPPPPPSSKPEDRKITKKRTRDRFSSASKKTADRNSSVESGKHGKAPPAAGSSSSHQPEESKKGQQPPASESKKRGAANFLSRMKQQTSSPTNNSNGELLDALKNTPLTASDNSSKGGGSEAPAAPVKNAAAGKRGATKVQTKEKATGSAKRNVGRPPKRGAAAAAATARPPPGKRGRERNESASPTTTRQPKKRSRKS